MGCGPGESSVGNHLRFASIFARLRRDKAARQGGAGMKNGFWIFLAVFTALGSSWCGFVLSPELQLGGAKKTTVLSRSDVYRVARPGEATQGSSVYRAKGCAACHTEQVRQNGMT